LAEADPLSQVRQQLRDLLASYMQTIEERLLSDDDENLLCHHSSMLTNLQQYQPLSTEISPELFALQISEENDLVGACRYITYLEEDVLDQSLSEQIKVFFKQRNQGFL
jgi:hypothetical protein